MNEGKRITKFKKDQMQIVLDDGSVINAPGYITSNYSGYRFCHETHILEKRCSKCRNHYPISRLDNDKFIDIHDDDVIKFISEKSGYNTYCRECQQKINIEKAVAGGAKILDLQSNERKSGLVLDRDQEKYVKHIAIELEISPDKCLRVIMRKFQQSNPLAIDLQIDPDIFKS